MYSTGSFHGKMCYLRVPCLLGPLYDTIPYTILVFLTCLEDRRFHWLGLCYRIQTCRALITGVQGGDNICRILNSFVKWNRLMEFKGVE